MAVSKTLSSKKNLKHSAEKNTSIIKSSKTSSPSTEVLKEGVPLDHSTKHDPQDVTTFRPKVGANIGCTLNMENYESMRIDCWLTDEVQEGETFEEAFARVIEIAQSQVELVAEQYKLN